MAHRKVLVNRAPVLALWAAVVAERLGYDRDAALTLGKAVSGLTAQTKGRSLGIFQPRPKTRAEAEKLKKARDFSVELLGRLVPCRRTAEGIRAVTKDKAVDPQSVERYLEQKFGPELEPARTAMTRLARSLRPEALAINAFSLYERFRPGIPAGTRGWGVKGTLDLDLIESLAEP